MRKSPRGGGGARRILKFVWVAEGNKSEITQGTGINNINDLVKKRRWKWFENVFGLPAV